jgi:hypothetical protein
MALAYCYDLPNVIYPTGLKSIGIESFKNCRSLSSVALHGNLESVGWSAFEGCTSLQKVVADNLECWCKIGFGNNGNPLINAHHLFIGDEEVTNLVIPSSIHMIHYGAFEGCTGLKSLFIHKDVKEIAYGAFNNCTSLERVDIEDLEAWCNIEFGSGDDTFSPLNYAHYLFLNGDEIKKLVIPDGIQSVKYESFQGCWSLTSVEIPSTVQYIGEFAFSDCVNIDTVIIHVKSPITLDGNEFTNRSNITLYVPAGCKATYKLAEYWNDFKEIIEMEPELVEKCAAPTIAYDYGELVLESPTEGAECHVSISTPDVGEQAGARVVLASTYTITAWATAEGYNDSDRVTATIRWRDGRPVLEGFSSVKLRMEQAADVNGDDAVGIGDIVTITNVMAGTVD